MIQTSGPVRWRPGGNLYDRAISDAATVEHGNVKRAKLLLDYGDNDRFSKESLISASSSIPRRRRAGNLMSGEGVDSAFAEMMQIMATAFAAGNNLRGRFINVEPGDCAGEVRLGAI